jgi:hypothetical protein
VTAAAIRGAYTNYRLVPSRNVVQAVIEFPAEQQQDMFATLGYPLPGKEIWVAVALLRNPMEESSPREPPSERPPANISAADPPPLSLAGATPKAKDLAKSERAREWFAQLDEEDKVVANAAMLCKDPAFQAWVGATDEVDAAFILRWRCDRINSRKELATNPRARALFDALLAKFQLDTGRIAEARG